MNLTPDHVEKVLSLIGFSSGLPDRRRGCATELARDGITEQHLDALTWRCLEAKSPGGMCDTILKAGWRKELDPLVRAKTTEKGENPAEKRGREDAAALKQRADWNGRTVPEQIIEERQGKVWELITRVHLTPAEAAERMGCQIDQILADLTERGSRFGRTLQQVLETSDPEIVARNIERIKRAAASQRRANEAKAARETEPLKLEAPAKSGEATLPPSGQMLPCTTAEIEAASERCRDFWQRHEAQTDRAWCERFGDELQTIDPELWKRMMSGPEPEPWIRERVSRATNRVWRDLHASLRQRDTERPQRGRLRT